ncbi:MAG: Nif11 family protein, partial [Clostridia bacterium]|nr:Nif11 family protein [Clostridia bacterium]
MSRESIVKFYAEVDKNANLKREFDGLREKTEKGQITNEKSIAKGIVSIAREHGFKFTEDELISYIREMQSTLSEEDLANISGGLLLELGLGVLMLFGGWAFRFCANTPRTHEAGQMEERQRDVEEYEVYEEEADAETEIGRERTQGVEDARRVVRFDERQVSGHERVGVAHRVRVERPPTRLMEAIKRNNVHVDRDGELRDITVTIDGFEKIHLDERLLLHVAKLG